MTRRQALNPPAAAASRPLLALALVGTGFVLIELVRFADYDETSRHGLWAALALGLAAAGRTSGYRALASIALGLALAAAALMLVPLLDGDHADVRELPRRTTFGALSLLAALGALTALLPGRQLRLLTALIGAIGAMAVIVRGFATLAVDDRVASDWPVLPVFVAPFAFAMSLIQPQLSDWRERVGAARLAVRLAALLALGLAAMVLIGSAIGSRFLTIGVGAQPMALPSALATAITALLLATSFERHPLWRVATLLLAALGLLLGFGLALAALRPALADALLGDVMLTRAPQLMLWIALALVAALLTASERPHRLAPRITALIALLGIGYSLVGLAGVFAGALFGVPPEFPRGGLSFLGLVALFLLGVGGFAAGVGRMSARAARIEALPAALFVVAMALAVSLHEAAQAQSAQTVAATTRVALNALARGVVSELERRVSDFERLARQLASDDAQAQRARLLAATRALELRYPALLRIAWQAEGAAPLLNPTARGSALPPELLAAERDLAQVAERRGGLAVTSADGARGWPLLLLAIRAEAASSGVLLVVLETDAESLRQSFGGAPPGYAARVAVDGRAVGFEGAAPLRRAVASDAEQSLRRVVAGASIEIAVWPVASTLAMLRTRVPAAVLVFGTLVAVLMAVVALLGTIARERAIAAERSRREIGELVEGMPYGFLAFDRSWRYAYMNRKAETLLRTRRERMLGTVLWSWPTVSLPATLAEAYRRSMNARSVEAVEFHDPRLGLWLAVQSFPLPDGIGVVFHDVSEEHEVREQLRRREAEREAALRDLELRNDELQQFAYVASHDLQEPLRKIQAFGDRLAEHSGAALDATGRDYLSRMQGAAQRMSGLIDDVLSYSRVTTRGAPFAPVALDEVLRQVLGDLELALRESGAEISVGPLPTIEADATQIGQLLQNLIGNAIKYRATGRVPRIRIEAERIVEPGAGRHLPRHWQRLRVIDNGIGFDNRHAERIFSPFQRLHGRGEYAGTGIGLAIVRKIAERHGGRVYADGRPGEGATFTVELPESRHEAPAPADSGGEPATA